MPEYGSLDKIVGDFIHEVRTDPSRYELP